MKTQKPNSLWSAKTLAITGGTGSFGQKYLEYALSTEVKRIVILSRDEYKHDLIRKKFNDDRIEFRICDVRDFQSVRQSLKGVNYLFHAAALKQVPSCEIQPIEAVKTNILGSENVLRAAVENQLESVVVLSTDKAVQPVNAMGISKAMMEKIALSWSQAQSHTKINVTRYGNVLFSRGSVLPFFFERAKSNKSIPVTNLEMTRFLLPLQDAIDLVTYALFKDTSGSIFVRKSPAASISIIVEMLEMAIGRSVKMEVIGVRPGEKIHETLLSEEELSKAIETPLYFEVKLDSKSKSQISAYSSLSTNQLNAEELFALLKNQPEYADY
jgi:UDP-N-acetylglucosamine 4,6-dehydratase